MIPAKSVVSVLLQSGRLATRYSLADIARRVPVATALCQQLSAKAGGSSAVESHETGNTGPEPEVAPAQTSPVQSEGAAPSHNDLPPGALWEASRLSWLVTGDPTPVGDIDELRSKLARLRAQRRRRTVTVNKAAVMATLRDPASPCSFTKNLPLVNLVAIYEEIWVEEGVQPL